MSRPVYSVNLYTDSLTVAGSQIAFVVPAGHTYVVRDIRIWTNSSTLQVLNMASTIGGPIFVQWQGTGASQNIELQGRLVFEQADQLEIATNGGTWNVKVSGYDLTN